MGEGLFVLILPVITTSSLSATCSLVNEISADPLGLYIMSNKQSEIEYVLQNTRSGGMAINDVTAQIAVLNLLSGGADDSG
jgi:acyl-CoA reductase-like NAD-dependent aldehyde dehydrogenase